MKKIGILTGGGDCPGLNAVIRAVTRTAILKYGYEVIGYKYGYKGIYENDYIKLNLEAVSGILHKGGTILYTSNKHNIFALPVIENGLEIKKDVSDIAVENMRRMELDALIVIGGDGTLTTAYDFSKKGVNVIGIPKTIDNDLISTDYTFGFHTAVESATDALDRLHTTAEAHSRVMILEVMGRTAGWIALESGIAGSADVILVPEIPYSLEYIIEKIKKREAEGKSFTMIVVAEGAKQFGGDAVVQKIVKDSPDPVRLGGIGNKLAYDLEKLLPTHEIRFNVLGHLQRGGITNAYDRILSTRFGVAAVDLISNNDYNKVVVFKDNIISSVNIKEVAGKVKLVPEGHQLITTARSIGISFGDR